VRQIRAKVEEMDVPHEHHMIRGEVDFNPFERGGTQAATASLSEVIRRID
jgi:hypothetical protein